MRRSALILALTLGALILAVAALLSPLGLLILRQMGWGSVAWVFGLWAILIAAGGAAHALGRSRQ